MTTDSELWKLDASGYSMTSRAHDMLRDVIAELRELRALLATPLPTNYDELERFGGHTSASWLFHDLHDDELIGLGAELIRAGLKARAK